MLATTLLIAAIVLLLLTLTAGVALTALQLPGTWLMIAAVAAFAWLRWGHDHFSYGGWTLVALLALAALGEFLEFIAGAAGTRNAGGSKRAAALSIPFAIAGAIVGSFAIPIPVVGTLLGAAIGAAAGALLGDRWAGRQWRDALTGARGAAVGKITGTVLKLVVAAAMWLTAAVALFL
ncbi:MAG: DUF456 domain-containing protein [Planctomycetota bacterium]